VSIFQNSFAEARNNVWLLRLKLLNVTAGRMGFKMALMHLPFAFNERSLHQDPLQAAIHRVQCLQRRRDDVKMAPPDAQLTQEITMTHLLSLVVCMAGVTWLLLLAASLIRAKGWTPEGMKIAMGNRENLPEATPLAGRADRTAKNTLEAFVLFAALALVAHVSGAQSPRIALGAEIFFWSRLVYIPVYYMGIPYLRTVVWTVGFVGLAMMAYSLG
jgi:uncharacterized MAPEG superfamily protein